LVTKLWFPKKKGPTALEPTPGFSKAQPNPHVVETGGQLRCEIGGLRKAPTQHGIEVLGALIASGSERVIHLGPSGYPIYVDAYC